MADPVITTVGEDTVYSFLASGTFIAERDMYVRALVVAGGGGGGNGDKYAANGGGGGAGEVVEVFNFFISAGSYSITVGAGGASATNGQDSTFAVVSAKGGGNGASNAYAAGTGGCGGGGNGGRGSTHRTHGVAVPYNVGCGYAGGDGASINGGGGGGGAGEVGQACQAYVGGHGGAGVSSDITGSVVYYGGGGGGANNTGGIGGNGGGGNGGTEGVLGGIGTAGASNTGGGGGGSASSGSPAGSVGGSGIVIIRFATEAPVDQPQLSVALDWVALSKASKTAQLEWATVKQTKFIPNIINFQNSYIIPEIQTIKNVVSMDCCFVGYSVILKNSGTTGTTSFDIYIKNELVASEIISATNLEYSNIIYLPMESLINAGNEISIKLISVASGAEDLVLNLYTMTFPFLLQDIYVGNIIDDYLLNGVKNNLLFLSSDYWSIDFNQPLLAVESIIAYTANNTEVELTANITNGDFYNNRILITPNTTDIIKQINCRVKDIAGRSYNFNFKPTIYDNYAVAPDYFYVNLEEVDPNYELILPVLVPFTSYRYSFDGGITWTASIIPDPLNWITLDFSGLVAGEKNILVEYLIGDFTITETLTINYITEALDCNINFLGEEFQLVYSDVVPFNKVEIYKDETLFSSLSPTLIDGCDTCGVNTGAKTITIAAGSIYYLGEKYTWAGTAVALDIDTEAKQRNCRVLFGFNTSSKTFEFKVYEPDTWNVSFNDSFANFINIFVQDICVSYSYTLPLTWSVTVYKQWAIFIENLISVDLSMDSDITVTVYDILGRYKEFTYSQVNTVYSIWRTLIVTDSEDNIIQPGQIHQNDSLTYTVGD